MKWFKIMTLSLFISGLSMTLGFAELQAFVDADKVYVRESEDYSSGTIAELKHGDRIEVLETTTPLLVSPYNQQGYITNSQVTMFSIKKSGDVVLSKNIKINTTKGEEVVEKGTKLPVYDYTNEHYMIKWNGFYYFIHETTVETKLTGVIEKPVLLTSEVFGKSEIAEVGLNDLFNEMDTTLSDYQNKVKVQEEAVVSSLIGKTEKSEVKVATVPTNPTPAAVNSTQATAKASTKPVNTGNVNVDKYANIPLIAKALEELEKPYVWGAIGPSSYDCSGFTYAMYKSIGITIPRVSADQGNGGVAVDKNNLKAGDLIFFDTRSVSNHQDITDDPNSSSIVVEVVNNGDDRTSTTSTVKKFVPTKVTHVGIYIGDGYFIHASSGERKIVIQSLDLNYYTDRYLWAKRYM